MEWLVPMARTVRWWPLAAVAAAASGLLGAVRLAGPVPPTAPVVGVLVAAVVAAVVAGLGDPLDELLQAVPTSPARRLVRRAGLLVTPGAAAAASVLTVGAALFGARWPALGPGPVVALAAVGVACSAMWSRRWGARGAELAGSAPLAWAVAGAVAVEIGADPSWALAWWRWPLPVVVVGAATASAAVTRR